MSKKLNALVKKSVRKLKLPKAIGPSALGTIPATTKLITNPIKLVINLYENLVLSESLKKASVS